MIEEPFWLGLMAVCIVLLILGIGYYFKKHVPDKFDKFLSYGVDVTSPVTEKPPGKSFVETFNYIFRNYKPVTAQVVNFVPSIGVSANLPICLTVQPASRPASQRKYVSN